MKRLILPILVISVVLFGACSQPAYELFLSEDKAPDYIWDYLLHNLPEGYTEANFQADTKTAIYQGKGIWTFTVYGTGNTRESEIDYFGELKDRNLGEEVIATLKSAPYADPDDKSVQSVYDLCLRGKCADMAVIEKKTIAYQLKLTADFDETQGVFKNLNIDKFEERIETEKFLLVPDPPPYGCCASYREFKIN